IVTTLTTVFGVLPLAMQDEFWAGLGYTIVFGLFAGSAMTLFVIPSLYFEVILRKKMNISSVKMKKEEKENKKEPEIKKEEIIKNN
ncbi:MAG: efflux RND transporter permease subunit, partial [Candidatus Gracilibacteria bacterium]|nr:efflux RND transporter permease subunit [Candidatus Gracilibacteria bacterium]